MERANEMRRVLGSLPDGAQLLHPIPARRDDEAAQVGAQRLHTLRADLLRESFLDVGEDGFHRLDARPAVRRQDDNLSPPVARVGSARDVAVPFEIVHHLARRLLGDA